jgi:hypothetical protein
MKNLALFSVGIILFSCGKKQETSLPTVGPITESIYASGVLKTSDQYQAFVTVNGIINEPSYHEVLNGFGWESDETTDIVIWGDLTITKTDE